MGQHHNHTANKNLKLAFFLNLGFTIIEIIGGIYTNSVAILSDAIHDLGDSLALGSAWYLNNKSQRKNDKNFSFGYTRFSLLGALINSLVLITGSVFVINEAISRLISPESSDAKGMIIFSIFGIIVNGYAAWKVSKGNTLNERVVTWHLLEDVLGWVAVLIGAIIIYFWDIKFLDPVLSLLITLYVLWNVFKRLKETLYIFLQGVPADININLVEDIIKNIEGIDSIHHTHIWSLDGEQHVFTTHIKLSQSVQYDEAAKIKRTVKGELKKYRFKHITIETELHNETC